MNIISTIVSLVPLALYCCFITHQLCEVERDRDWWNKEALKLMGKYNNKKQKV
jgi:hypothetical protein